MSLIERELLALKSRIAALEGQIRRVPANFARPPSGPGDSIRFKVTQANDFEPFTAVRHSGSAWVKAQGDQRAGDGALGVVESATPDVFVVVLAGRISLAVTKATGSWHLSPTTAGALVQYSSPLSAPGGVRILAQILTSGASTAEGLVFFTGDLPWRLDIPDGSAARYHQLTGDGNKSLCFSLSDDASDRGVAIRSGDGAWVDTWDFVSGGVSSSSRLMPDYLGIDFDFDGNARSFTIDLATAPGPSPVSIELREVELVDTTTGTIKVQLMPCSAVY